MEEALQKEEDGGPLHILALIVTRLTWDLAAMARELKADGVWIETEDFTAAAELTERARRELWKATEEEQRLGIGAREKRRGRGRVRWMGGTARMRIQSGELAEKGERQEDERQRFWRDEVGRRTAAEYCNEHVRAVLVRTLIEWTMEDTDRYRHIRTLERDRKELSDEAAQAAAEIIDAVIWTVLSKGTEAVGQIWDDEKGGGQKERADVVRTYENIGLEPVRWLEENVREKIRTRRKRGY